MDASLVAPLPGPADPLGLRGQLARAERRRKWRAFSLTLPSGAPVKTAYVAGAASLSFVADGVAPTGKYTLVATSGGATKPIAIDVTSADWIGSAFTFP